MGTAGRLEIPKVQESTVPDKSAALAAAQGDPRLTRARRALVVAATAAHVALCYLTAPSLFEGMDYRQLHEPTRVYLARALREGRLPLWNPHVGLGRPFLADIETAALYPPNLVFVVLSPEAGLVAVTFLHALLAVFGMSALCRRLGAGLLPSLWAAFAFLSAAPLAARLHVGQVHYYQGSCYLPLVFLLALKVRDRPSARTVALLAAALGLQLLSGHPQIAWVTWVGAGAFLAGHAAGPGARAQAGAAAASLLRFALALAWALALAAALMLPFLEFVTEGNRAQPSMAFAAQGSMPTYSWASLVTPYTRARPFYWEFDLYGGIALVLAGVAGLSRTGHRGVRALVAMSALAVLIALGTRTPAFSFFYYALPGVASLHLHARLLVLLLLALAAGSALFLSPGGGDRRSLLVLAGATAGVLAAVAAWHARLPRASEEPLALRLALVVATALLLYAWHAGGRGARAAGRWAGGLLLAVTAADLGFAVARMKAAYRTRAEFPLEEPVRGALLAAGLLGPDAPPPRLAFAPGFLRPNSGMLDGHGTFTGWVGLWPARVWSYLHEMQGLAILDSQNSATPDRIGGYPFPYDTMNLVLGVDPATAGLAWNARPDPRAFVTDTAAPVPDWRTALARLRGGHDARVALVEGVVDAPAAAAAAPRISPARIVRFSAERIEVEADTARPGWLVLGEAWYPGWRAEVNGTEAACVPANVWMRAVPLPAGRSRVTLRFRSRLLLPGAAVSVAAAALLAWCLRRRRPVG